MGLGSRVRWGKDLTWDFFVGKLERRKRGTGLSKIGGRKKLFGIDERERERRGRGGYSGSKRGNEMGMEHSRGRRCVRWISLRKCKRERADGETSGREGGGT